MITPFYTHLNERGEECGILVNRGFLPDDFKNVKMHYTGVTSGSITGVLYRGDCKTKYSSTNEPTIQRYTEVHPYDFSLLSQMPNIDESSAFMLQQVDTDPDTRQILPNLPQLSDLVKWKISTDRHEAYSSMWKYMTFIGVFANTTLWLYF